MASISAADMCALLLMAMALLSKAEAILLVPAPPLR
jgi:hypothetical protein